MASRRAACHDIHGNPAVDHRFNTRIQSHLMHCNLQVEGLFRWLAGGVSAMKFRLGYLALPIALIPAGCAAQPPTDNQMARTFHRSKVYFDEIKDFACKRPEGQVFWPIENNIKPAVTPEDFNRMKVALKNIGATGFRSEPKCQIFIEVWSGSRGLKGVKFKKYRYGRSSKETILPSLDQVKLSSSHEKQIYEKPLSDDWWLRYESSYN